AVATLMDVLVPELEPWRDRAHAALAQHRAELEEELNEDGRLPDDWDSDLESLENEWGPLEDLDELDEFDDDELGFDDESDDDLDLVRPMVHGDPKVGRNDPCPCGSEKKFKKCCMNRQKNPPKIDW